MAQLDVRTPEAALSAYFGVAAGIRLERAWGEGARDFAVYLERTPEFTQVLDSIRTLERTPALRNKISGQDRIALATFFRRSGIYLRLFSGESLSALKVATQLREMLVEPQMEVTYLAPLELIHLTQDQLVFGPFVLRRFPQNELAYVTQNEIRKTFYPWAALDLGTLSDYWFLVAKETVDIKPMLDLSDLFNPEVRLSYSSLPRPIERALHPLVLCDWIDLFTDSTASPRPVRREAGDETLFPDIPFVIKLTDNWFDSFGAAPPMERLAREPIMDYEGEEIGDSPSSAFHFDPEETIKLEQRLQGFAERLELIERNKPDWRFVDTALGFLTKAFRSNGLEQLLWHITAIEAVLGQNTEGLTSLLKRRVSTVFGGSERERKDLRRRFDELYKYRSDLVHGNADLEDKPIVKGRLREARDFARGVVAWAVASLAYLERERETDSEPRPTREDLLLLLDMTPKTRLAIARALRRLPSEFPSVEDWLS